MQISNDTKLYAAYMYLEGVVDADEPLWGIREDEPRNAITFSPGDIVSFVKDPDLYDLHTVVDVGGVRRVVGIYCEGTTH